VCIPDARGAEPGGWDTPQQLADPAYQAGKFFNKLLTVDGWQQLPLTNLPISQGQPAWPRLPRI
jgi:hypothetical protein